MNRRSFIQSTLLGATAATALATPIFAADPWVNDLNKYFNDLRTAFATFSQTDPNGRKTSGRFYLQKPGKMRFEYDDPKYPLTVSDGNTLAIFDPKSNTGPQTYPQNITPVSLLARDNVDLTGTKFVKKITKKGNEGLISLYDPANAQYGELILRVDIAKRALLGWQAVDQAGGRTTISLSNLSQSVAMNPNLFNIVKIKNSR